MNIELKAYKNGKPIPISDISVETFKALREDSVPKEKPREIRVGDCFAGACQKFIVTKIIAKSPGANALNILWESEMEGADEVDKDGRFRICGQPPFLFNIVDLLNTMPTGDKFVVERGELTPVSITIESGFVHLDRDGVRFSFTRPQVFQIIAGLLGLAVQLPEKEK